MLNPQNKLLENTPLVSVAMPIYNAGAYLRLAVVSIIEQTYQNWELLIIDDGSTDGCLQNIEDINDSRVSIINDGQNAGLAMRLNQAIDMAKGKYLARMDQDDFSFPDRLFKQVQLLESNPKLDLVASGVIAISESDQVIGKVPCPVSHSDLCANPWKGFPLPHPTWMGKIEWFRKNKYKIPGPYFCEDQELLLRTHMNSNFSAVSDYVFAYRIRQKRNLARVIKTRFELLSIQSNFFIKSKQISNLILAWLFFFILVLRDFWWHIFKFNSISIKPASDIGNDEVYKKWHQTIINNKDYHGQ